MKNNVIIFILIVFILFSCKDKSSQKEFYYKTGELKEKIVYPDAKDTTTFHGTIYYKNGKPMKIVQIVDNQVEGKMYVFNQNGNLKDIETYKNNKLHGLSARFNSKGEILNKCFFLNGKPINTIEFAHTKNKKRFRDGVFRIHTENDTTFERMGHLIYTDSNNIIDSSSFYYKIEAEDTINYGKQYHFKLTFHNNYNYSLKLLVGELNKDLQFIHPNKVYTYTSPGKSVEGAIGGYEPGWNLFLGKLYVYPDSLNKHPQAADEYEFIVFKEVYVLQVFAKNKNKTWFKSF